MWLKFQVESLRRTKQGDTVALMRWEATGVGAQKDSILLVFPSHSEQMS